MKQNESTEGTEEAKELHLMIPLCVMVSELLGLQAAALHDYLGCGVEAERA